MWNRSLACGLAAASLAIAVVPAEALAAEPVSERTLGIGLEFGHGPGLSVKYEPAPTHALQFGVYAFDYGIYRQYALDHGNAYYGYAYGYSGFLVHGDYLNTPGVLLRNRGFELPWYWGGGLDLGVGAGAAAFAVHGNLGLALKIRPLPLDVFLEWTPRLWIVDFTQFHPVDFNAGVRVWF